jgi:hypothetical protein
MKQYTAIVRDKDGNVYYSEPQDKVRKVKLARLNMLLDMGMEDELTLVIDNNQSIKLMMYDFKIREFLPHDINSITIEQISELRDKWISQLKASREITRNYENDTKNN